ncbi:MAG: site-specific DNA-methyltransferase [Planctomycetes bacterium]|nr:site-specific DNA-methyltransferase [Planctomycetota bacterium]
MRGFRDFGSTSAVGSTEPTGGGAPVPTYANEFWTAKQRAAHSLHEVSYRACFKPQLPRFFVERLTEAGDLVHDPFLGRGTTALEAALCGRVPTGTDVNPLSRVLLEPRLRPPTREQVASRLERIDFGAVERPGSDELLVFYHPDTLREIESLRLAVGDSDDPVDAWIRMVAVNRLTGHSPGFFSVYTLPPNQAVSVAAQHKINERREQTPPRRDVAKLILRKSDSLLAHCDVETRARLATVAKRARILTGEGASSPDIAPGSVSLVVTSPPFLDVVQYKADNWLRCWFCGIDPDQVSITHLAKIEAWQAAMTDVMRELHRIVRPGGVVAFEVGEVRGGKVKLEEVALRAGLDAGFAAEFVLINVQQFTKTANCWGVDNNTKGTNSNRIVVLARR